MHAVSAGKPAPVEVYPRTRTAWRRWLAKNHKDCSGVWLIYDKASTGRQKLPYGDAVEEALCFGWVDSTVRGIDAGRYMQYFAPRKPKSVWSGPNKERVARLIDQKQMRPAGFASIEIAKQNGSWETLDSVEAMVIPEALAAALAEVPVAEANFAGFSPSSRKGYLYWINAGKSAETRAKRIAETVALSAVNRKSRHLP